MTVHTTTSPASTVADLHALRQDRRGPSWNPTVLETFVARPRVRQAPWQPRYVALLVGLDAVAATAALLMTALLGSAGEVLAHPVLAASLPPLWVLGQWTGRAYESRALMTGSEEYRRSFDAAVRVTAALAIGALALRGLGVRDLVLVTLPLATAATLCLRWGARRVLARLRRRQRCLHRVLVLGDEEGALDLVAQMRRAPESGYEIVAALLTGDSGERLAALGVPVLGNPRIVTQALELSGADTIAVAADGAIGGTVLKRICWELEGTGVDVLVAPTLTDVAGPRVHVRPVAGLPLLHVEEPEFSGVRRLAKNGTDRLLAGVAVLLLAPVLLGLAVAVRATSPGSAFFRQVRVGVDGTRFTMYKYRSMYVDAEARLADLAAVNAHGEGAVLFKMRQDPRVTRLGRVLRRLSLDELPQLLNVVKGDMSLVGPRPPLPAEVERYGHHVGRRLLVRPGITGLWQVSGRADLDWEESVRLDLYYVENWSPALDLSILVKTIATVRTGRGAY